MKQQKQKEPNLVRFKGVSDPSPSLVTNATQQNVSSSKDDKVTTSNKKRYVNNIIGQDKEMTSDWCISDSGSVESGSQVPNSYFASSSSEELSDSDDE